MKREPPAPAIPAKTPSLSLDPKKDRAGRIRDKLRKALDDPEMREQMVRVIRQFMTEEK